MEAQGNNRHWKESRKRERERERYGPEDRETAKCATREKANGIYLGNTTEDRTCQTNPRKESGGAGRNFGKEGHFFSPLAGKSICSMGACEDLQRSDCPLMFLMMAYFLEN